MSRIIESILNDVCLDERISDGIFRMDEEEHMNALRDHLIFKRGLTEEDAIHVTNRMTEGKYPDRQAWRVEDGILVTWPSAQHMAKAFAKPENKGKYTNRDPNPKKAETVPEPKGPPGGGVDLPPDKTPVSDKEDDTKEEPTQDKSDLFKSDTAPKEDGQELEVEPPRGNETPESQLPAPTTSPVVAPRTPERVAAEKEIAKQIFNSDNTVLSGIDSFISEKCQHELNELYITANKLGMKEAVTFLTPFIHS